MEEEEDAIVIGLGAKNEDGSSKVMLFSPFNHFSQGVLKGSSPGNQTVFSILWQKYFHKHLPDLLHSPPL